MARPKSSKNKEIESGDVKVEWVETPTPPTDKVKSEKEKLLDLYQTLKDLNIRSISDLENLIARAE